MNTTAENLDRFERWMLHVVSHPKGLEAGLASDEAKSIWPNDSIEEICEAGPELSALERMRVYSDMYYWRLIDVLAEDYPTVRFVMGGDNFYDFAIRYIHRFPSTSPNLSHLGQNLPLFIAETEHEVTQREFLVDVARVECASSICFDEKDKPSIPSEELLGIPPDSWGNVRLDLIPAHRLLELNFPVDDFIQAHRDDQHMEIPEQESSWMLVYRRDYSIWRSSISEAQFVMLRSLAAGGTLLAAIEAAANLPHVDFDVLVSCVGGWFQIWTGIGLFAGLRPS